MSLAKIFGQVFEILRPTRYYCSVIGCHASTTGKDQTGNVRKRWILGQEIGDETEKEIVNLCPVHVVELLNVTEKDYTAMEVGEEFASGKMSIEKWNKEISQAR